MRRIEFVITIDEKYTEKPFLSFWYRFNNEYNQITSNPTNRDDVEIYFDYKIGIVAPPEETNTGGGGTRRSNILEIILRRNAEEDRIEELIVAYEEVIEKLFSFINEHKEGERFVYKIKSDRTTFSHEDILKEFERFYNRFFRRNKDNVSQDFKRETKDMVSQLCDLFEEKVKE